MFVKHHTEIVPEKVTQGKGITIQWLIDEKVGAPHFALRRFTLEEGGYTPYHTHDWEHEVYVLEGEGSIVDEKGIEHPLRTGDVTFVDPSLKHQFKNCGKNPFIFLCIIPLK